MNPIDVGTIAHISDTRQLADILANIRKSRGLF
jgi:hypothetical protein